MLFIFGESGDKSATLINIEKDESGVRVSTEAISFAKYSFRICNADCSGLSEAQDVYEAAARAAQQNGFGADDLVRVRLTGSVDPSLRIDPADAAEYIKGVKYAQVRDETSPTWNAGWLAADKGIRGEVYRTLLPKLESADPVQRDTAARALRYALSALAGEL